MQPTHVRANGRIWKRQIRPRWQPDAEPSPRPAGEALSLDLDRTSEYAIQEVLAADVPTDDALAHADERSLQVAARTVTWSELPLLHVGRAQLLAHSIVTWRDREIILPHNLLNDLFIYVNAAGERVRPTKRATLVSNSGADLIALFPSSASITTKVNPDQAHETS